MTESELAHALHELPPEPPRGLSADDLLQRARQRRALRLSSVAAGMVIVGAAGVTAVHAGAGRSTSVVVARVPTPSVTATPTESPPAQSPHSNPPAVDMHADTVPGSATSTMGSADLDGDGKLDAVTVSARTGLVVVELGSGAELTAQLPVSANGRLQGLPDLLGDGRREVLVYSSAAGCCGYAPVDSQSYVLAIAQGRLSLVRFENGKPLQLSFSNGRGDTYAQVKCQGNGSIINSHFYDSGASSYYSSIKIEGSLATGVTIDNAGPRDPTQDFPVALGCAGLRADGRAS